MNDILTYNVRAHHIKFCHMHNNVQYIENSYCENSNRYIAFLDYGVPQGPILGHLLFIIYSCVHVANQMLDT